MPKEKPNPPAKITARQKRMERMEVELEMLPELCRTLIFRTLSTGRIAVAIGTPHHNAWCVCNPEEFASAVSATLAQREAAGHPPINHQLSTTNQ